MFDKVKELFDKVKDYALTHKVHIFVDVGLFFIGFIWGVVVA